MLSFRKDKRISAISAMHYGKLGFRSLLLVMAAILYIRDRVNPGFTLRVEEARYSVILMVIWIVYAVEMVFRLFPSKIESLGCQKQFAHNYLPVENGALPDQKQIRRSTLAVAASWIALNSVFGVLYFTGVIGWGLLLLLSQAYAVCDMICILFFCPFQTWFMKNKCCGSCRIYNWDYAMMFTPLVFVPAVYTWSLLGLGLLLLAYWEIMYARHPERFFESTNQSLRCANCPEKLCHHKKQLQRFLKTYWKQLRQLPEEVKKEWFRP